MTRTHYELLGVPPAAPADEIKRAFRREIARYHPDKVQHLGQEFQDIAVARTAELTQAYKTLSEAATRAAYDERLRLGAASAPAEAGEAEPSQDNEIVPPPPPPSEPSPAPSGPAFATDRASATDLIRKAALARFRHALDGEFGRYDEPPVDGFDLSCVPKPAFFSLTPPARVLARIVDRVDGVAMVETWSLASRMKRDLQRDLCVFVMGPHLAPAADLAAVVARHRGRKAAAGGTLTMVPVSTQDWRAHVPIDAPPLVKALLARLRA